MFALRNVNAFRNISTRILRQHSGLAAFNQKLRYAPDIEPEIVTLQRRLNHFKGSNSNNKLRLSEASFGALPPVITMDKCNSLLFDEVNRFDGNKQPVFMYCSKLMFHNCNHQFEEYVLAKRSMWNVNGLETIFTNSEYVDNILPLTQIRSVKNIFVNDKNTWKLFEEHAKIVDTMNDNVIQYVNDWNAMVTVTYINNVDWANVYNSSFIPYIQYEPNFNDLIQKILDTQFALKKGISS